MNVKYQIIVEVTADGMMGPLKVLDLVRNAVGSSEGLRSRNVRVGQVRCAAVYPVVENVEEGMVTRVPGRDQSRQVEEVRDQQDRV